MREFEPPADRPPSAHDSYEFSTMKKMTGKMDHAADTREEVYNHPATASTSMPLLLMCRHCRNAARYGPATIE